MEGYWILVVSSLTLIGLSHEESRIEEIDVKLKDEFNSNPLNVDLHLAQQLGDSNTEFAVDLYRQFTADSETGTYPRDKNWTDEKSRQGSTVFLTLGN